MSALAATVGGWYAFGKLRTHADFVRLGEGAAELARFDDWLTEGVEWAHARAGRAWLEAFRPGTVRAFALRTGAQAGPPLLLVGAIGPSADRAGRAFPISVLAPLSIGTDLLQNPQLLPLACEHIWQSASQCVTALSAAESAPLPGLPAPLGPAQASRFSHMQAAYSAWGDGLPVAELSALMLGAGQQARLRAALCVVAEAVKPQRSRENPGTQLSLRLPLGAASGAEVCFWLDVVRRLIGWRSTVPSFFWSHDGTSGQLTVHLGALPPASICELWLPTAERDEFCELSLPVDPTVLGGLPALPEAIEHALAVPHSVAALLDSLGGSR